MFQVGDIVRLKHGTAAIKVTKSSTNRLSGTYVNSDNHIFERSHNDFVLFEGETTMTKLYEVNNKFATKIAVNSAGMWVMEEKGSGEVFTANKADCIEVVPYTVSINFGGGKEYHYTSVEGKFKVGDLLWMPDNGYGEGFARVTGVNTKSTSATKELEPVGRFVLDTSLNG